jgi:hypothetical protein
VTWTYDVTNLTSTAPNSEQQKDRVRFLIGDTLNGDQQLQDEEIQFSLQLRSSIYGAASRCCFSLATQFARRADSVQGPLHVAYSQQSKNYRAMGLEFLNDANSFGAFPGYAGGISISDKDQREMDSDREPPQFNIGMTDNFLPVAPAGNETNDLPSDDSQNQ